MLSVPLCANCGHTQVMHVMVPRVSVAPPPNFEDCTKESLWEAFEGRSRLIEPTPAHMGQTVEDVLDDAARKPVLLRERRRGGRRRRPRRRRESPAARRASDATGNSASLSGARLRHAHVRARARRPRARSDFDSETDDDDSFAYGNSLGESSVSTLSSRRARAPAAAAAAARSAAARAAAAAARRALRRAPPHRAAGAQGAPSPTRRATPRARARDAPARVGRRPARRRARRDAGARARRGRLQQARAARRGGGRRDRAARAHAVRARARVERAPRSRAPRGRGVGGWSALSLSRARERSLRSIYLERSLSLRATSRPPKKKGQKAQTLKELERGFRITAPTPIVAGGEIRLTNEVGELYLTLLESFADEKLALLEDERAFVDAAFKYDVFLERHWKKLTRDLRTGKLNRHVPIDDARRAPSRRARARAARARRPPLLEQRLRALGFHQRARATRRRDQGRDQEAAARLPPGARMEW